MKKFFIILAILAALVLAAFVGAKLFAIGIFLIKVLIGVGGLLLIALGWWLRGLFCKKDKSSKKLLQE